MAVKKTDSTYLRHQEKPFTVVMNDIAQGVHNPDALAIWVYLQSKSSGWKVIASHIRAHFGIGRDRYRTAMRELSSLGLIEYVAARDDEGKMLGKEIIVNWQICAPKVQVSDRSENPTLGETTPYEKKESSTKEKEVTKCANSLRDAFAVFWKAVHNKKDKARAERYFNREAKKHGDAMAFAEMLIEDMTARLEAGQQGFAAMHPTTYLNNRRWEDERPVHCPHAKIIELWNSALPDHIEKVSMDDWTPALDGFHILANAWETFKTKPRASTGKPVFESEEAGLAFYGHVFAKLAKTHYANREDAGQFVTLKWTVQQNNTARIFKGEIQ